MTVNESAGVTCDYEEYAAHEGINATSLKAGAVSMKKMRYAMTNDDDTVSPVMRMGKWIHGAVLEPVEFFKTVKHFDGPTRKAKGYKAFCEENDGAEILVGDELAHLSQLSASVHSNPHAHSLIERSRHEVALYWTDEMYGAGKARLDGMGSGVVELKSTKSDLTTRGFERLCYNMGYHIQFGWYALGMKRVCELDQLPPVHVIALKQNEDMDCRVFRVSDGLLDLGIEEATNIAKAYHVAELMGSFPGVSDEIDLLEPPMWARGGEAWSPEESAKESNNKKGESQ